MTANEKTLRARVARMADRGVIDAEIARQCGCSREYVGQVLGRRGKRAKSNRPARPYHRIYAHNKEYRAAQKVAAANGHKLLSGENTGKGSVGLMVEAIGAGELVVVDAVGYAELYGMAYAGDGEYGDMPEGVPVPKGHGLE